MWSNVAHSDSFVGAQGCDGVPHSGRAVDACGDCGGNNLCKLQVVTVMLGESMPERRSRRQTSLLLGPPARASLPRALLPVCRCPLPAPSLPSSHALLVLGRVLASTCLLSRGRQQHT
jgi:hypothetical protein